MWLAGRCEPIPPSISLCISPLNQIRPEFTESQKPDCTERPFTTDNPIFPNLKEMANI